MEINVKKSYAVVYYEARGVYNVNLYDVADNPLQELKDKAEKFNKNNKVGRAAVVVSDQLIVDAFRFFHNEQKELNRRMKNMERSLAQLADTVLTSSFLKVYPKES